MQGDPEALKEGFGALVVDIGLYPVIECFARLRIRVGIDVAPLFNDVVSYLENRYTYQNAY